jgi:hypothetical protein
MFVNLFIYLPSVDPNGAGANYFLLAFPLCDAPKDTLLLSVAASICGSVAPMLTPGVGCVIALPFAGVRPVSMVVVAAVVLEATLIVVCIWWCADVVGCSKVVGRGVFYCGAVR